MQIFNKQEKYPTLMSTLPTPMLITTEIVITCNEYTLVISFKDLCDSLVLERRDSKVIVYLSLKRPPRIFGKEKHPLGSPLPQSHSSAFRF